MPTTKSVLEELVVLERSGDARTAFLKQVPGQRCPAIPRDELVGFLKDHGVVYGIREDALLLFEEGTWNGDRLLVAEATPPVTGQNGTLEIVFHDRVVNDGGRIDPKDRGTIRSVPAGQVIAIVHLPTSGTPGTGLDGEPLPAHDGKPAEITLGEGVGWSSESNTQIVATVGGSPVFAPGGRIKVDHKVTVNGNVDLAVGNIDFAGSLVVRGDILSDFTVKVAGTLEVDGNVEDATLDVGGDVVIRKGFYGSGKGVMNTGGTVRVQHILNQTVNAAQDVLIDKEAVNATVVSGGSITAPHAVIAGGTMDALRDIDVGTLGSEDGGQAKVKAGKRGRLLERIGQIDREVKHAEKQLAEVKNAVFRLIKMKVDGVTLNAEQEAGLAKLQDAQRQLPKRIDQLHDERAKTNAELQKNTDSKVVVRGTVYENVMIEINGVRRVIDSAVEGAAFTLHNGTISIQAL
jgi:uncharacterized protein (DUF342 family)